MLLDRLMPAYDFSEYHEIGVRASPEGVFESVGQTNFAANRIVSLLLAIRALPARITGRGSARESSTDLNLRNAEQFGFFIAGENPPFEIALALQGKFWTVSGGTECSSREALKLPIAPGTARAIWNFSITPVGESFCTLATETRILCSDRHALRRFRIYWFFVRPGSGVIRRMMLRTIRDLAETRGQSAFGEPL